MSKGPGKCQRLILERLATTKPDTFFYLVDLLGPHTMATYQAFHRAAGTLEKAGKINVSKAYQLMIHHIDTKVILAPHPKAGQPNETQKGKIYPPLIRKCVSVYSETPCNEYTLKDLVQRMETVMAGTEK